MQGPSRSIRRTQRYRRCVYQLSHRLLSAENEADKAANEATYKATYEAAYVKPDGVARNRSCRGEI